MLPRWKKLSSQVVFENPWWRYRKDQFEITPGRRGEYHYASTYGSAMVIPFTASGEIVLVEQYRYLLDRPSLEFPCGGVVENEPPLSAARRELAEESGYTAELQAIGRFTPWNGVTDEICHVFLAEPVVPDSSSASPDETEAFVIHRVSRGDFERKIAEGVIWDGMTLAAYALYRARLG